MKRLFAAVIVILAAASCTAASDRVETPLGGTAAMRKGPTTRTVLERSMPQAMADGMVKVAVVRNLAVNDHSRQFLEGCVSEGRAMGFVVDTFVTGGDEEHCKQLLARIARSDYDGIIFSSHDREEFAWDALKPLVDQGIKAVTFDTFPHKTGDGLNGFLPGLTSTFQEDFKLARMTLDSILSYCGLNGQPPRIIRVWAGPGISPLDRRQKIWDAFVQEGKIVEAALISPRDFAYSRSGVREALAAILPRFPQGTVDAIWAPYDEFAKGCADALADAGRWDIKLVSIDISNDDIRMMLDHSAIWLASAAVDPALIGIVNMRLLAAKFASEDTPAVYMFEPQIIETSRLNSAVTMANLSIMVPGWGLERGLFDQYQWMADLKTAERMYLRLPLVKPNLAATGALPDQGGGPR